jgi:murein DD-endopeptidase MepM/ murein hydrolase activator NlpD
MIVTALGFLGFFFLPAVVRACGVGGEYAESRGRAWWWYPGLVFGLWGLGWLGAYLAVQDRVNLSDYPIVSENVASGSSGLTKKVASGNSGKKSGPGSPTPSPTPQYLLPFPAGESSWVIQGNNTRQDHNSSHFGQQFAWDLVLRCGTPVLASRSGTIANTPIANFDSFGPKAKGNQVVVDHGDGTFAYYVHIQYQSVPFKFMTAGTPVKAGEEIAKVGCVGIAWTGHIHFQVRPDPNNNKPTIAVVFKDVSDDNGIPRTFKTYTSGNQPMP